MSSLTALIAFLLLTFQEVAVEVRSLQSDSRIQGQLQLIDQQKVEYRSAGRSTTVEFGKLKSLTFEGRTKQLSNSPIVLVLRDGSRLLPDQILSSGQIVQAELGSGYSVSIATSQTQSVQFQKLSDKQQTQWRAIQDSRLTDDLLAITRSADSLDKIEGLITELGAEKVLFEFSKQKIEAPRNKLAGLRFFSRNTPLLKTTAVISDTRGNSWQASEMQFAGGTELNVTLSCGEKVRLPVNQLFSIDFSIGSQIYVAELTPVSHLAVGGPKLKQAIAGSEKLLGPQAVQLPNSSGSSLKMLGSGSVIYRVPSEYKSLSGKAILAPQGEQYTPCKVQIKLENEVIWEAQLEHPSRGAEFSLSIEPDKRLQLIVQADAKYPVGDVVIWQELRMLK